MNTCLICKKNELETSGDILLSNNLFVHKNCEQDLYQLVKNKTEGMKTLQKSIYDYWPSYPPDWDERKKAVREKRKGCLICGKASTRKYRKCPLEFHHIIPISAGGNHLDSNLELICKSCHKKEHERNPHKFRKKR